MDIKKYFDTIDINEIERFVQDGQEENLFIEFKTAVHPNYKDNNREIDWIYRPYCATKTGHLVPLFSAIIS